MTVKALEECFALVGANLMTHKDFVTLEFKGIRMDIRLDLTDNQLEKMMWLFNLNMPTWFKLIKESLAEEQKGGKHD